MIKYCQVPSGSIVNKQDLIMRPVFVAIKGKINININCTCLDLMQSETEGIRLVHESPLWYFLRMQFAVFQSTA